MEVVRCKMSKMSRLGGGLEDVRWRVRWYVRGRLGGNGDMGRG